MSREYSPAVEREHSTPPLRAKPGLKAIAWMGTLLSVAGPSGPVEAEPRKPSEKVGAEPFRYEGTMMVLPMAADLYVERSTKKDMPDGKTVTVYEGTHLLPADEVKEERVLDVHVLDAGDPKVKGDERWSECQIIVRTFNDAARAKDFGYLCLDSASDARASGLHMDSPVGDYAFFGPEDDEWKTSGAMPKTGDDWTLYELNTLYWAMKGLQHAGADQSEAAHYLAKEFRAKIAEAQSHGKTHPMNQDILDELKS